MIFRFLSSKQGVRCGGLDGKSKPGKKKIAAINHNNQHLEKAAFFCTPFLYGELQYQPKKGGDPHPIASFRKPLGRAMSPQTNIAAVPPTELADATNRTSLPSNAIRSASLFSKEF